LFLEDGRVAIRQYPLNAPSTELESEEKNWLFAGRQPVQKTTRAAP